MLDRPAAREGACCADSVPALRKILVIDNQGEAAVHSDGVIRWVSGTVSRGMIVLHAGLFLRMRGHLPRRWRCRAAGRSSVCNTGAGLAAGEL